MIKKAILSLVIFFSIERFCHKQTDGFKLSKMVITHITPSQPSSMTLHFIGAGKQFYAFETPDHQYVVKFMKFSRRRPLPWLEQFPFTKQYLAERAKRLSSLHKSSMLASQTLAEETGLIPFSLPSTLTLVDKLGISHTIELSQTSFVVQRKAALFPPYFEQNPSQSQSLITSYIATIESQCRKGVCNLDPILERNYGVVNGRLILIDIGSLLAHHKLKNRAKLQQQIFLELLPLRTWLLKHHPEHISYFDTELKKTILLQY